MLLKTNTFTPIKPEDLKNKYKSINLTPVPKNNKYQTIFSNEVYKAGKERRSQNTRNQSE